MSDRSTVMALIGAGPVGLGMAKALLEHKIPYEQLEADDQLGGNWYHGVYDTVHIISSRKTTQYALSDARGLSGFPEPPADAGVFARLCREISVVSAHPVQHKSSDGFTGGSGRWELELASGEKRIYMGGVFATGITGTGAFRTIREHSKARTCIRRITEVLRN